MLFMLATIALVTQRKARKASSSALRQLRAARLGLCCGEKQQV